MSQHMVNYLDANNPITAPYAVEMYTFEVMGHAPDLHPTSLW